ncbi:MAG: hypothetical protein II600_02710, partial [Bacteroidaceae bacterium]|nr:hypothetical protein [Bacteroidaceae bacterium]
QFTASSINIEENNDKEPVNYILPPGISRVVDPSQPQLVLPRQPEREGDVLAERGQRTADQLRGNDRQGHRAEPDEPLLLQPERRRQQGLSERDALAGCRSDYGRGCQRADHRRVPARGGYTVRLPHTGCGGRWHRQDGQRADCQRQRLRPQLGAEQPGRHHQVLRLHQRPDNGHRDEDVHRPAGRAVLCRQLPGWQLRGQEGCEVSASQRFLLRDAALSRQPQPAGLPQHDTAAGRDLRHHYHLPVWRG